MSMRSILSRGVAALLIVAVAMTASAQQSPTLSDRAKMIKRKADSLSPRSPISVIPIHGSEEFGDFLSNDQEGFTFQDIDRRTEVTLRYTEVRKLKKGHGGYNFTRSRHTDRTTGIIVTAVVLGALGGIIWAAAAARN